MTEEQQEEIQQTQEEEIKFGRFEYKDGTIYEGNWTQKDGKKIRQGEGTLTQPYREEYKGSWNKDKMEGYGVYNYTSGASYQGYWLDGKAHGKGIYEFQDGSIYDGEWFEHMMHGEGCYINHLGKKYYGEFVEGVYQSQIQEQLKIQKIQQIKKAQILEEATPFFSQFEQKFSISDKKTFKDNLSPFFGNGDEINTLYSNHCPKFEDKQPAAWKDALVKFTEESTKINVLINPQESKFLNPEHILCPQLDKNGQIVEFDASHDNKIFQAAIIQTNGRWVLLHYQE